MSRVMIRDNADQFFRNEYDTIVPSNPFHTVKIENVMDYAAFVHYKEGYYVIDEENAAEVIDALLDPILESDEPFSDREIEQLLEAAADEFIQGWQRFINGTKEPVEAGRRRRPKHDGEWANITTELVSNFYTRVNKRRLKKHPNPGQPPEVADVSKYARSKSPPSI
jgi:hypothetical protein